jgi:hypothetical protein
MAKNRIYSYKDVDMLMASKTIAASFRVNIAELSATRSLWTDQYANDLISRIDHAFANCLGTDAKKDLRTATIALAAIQYPARRDIAFFKTQIDADFKKDPAKRYEILTTLGYASYFRGVQLGNQEALIQLLYAFKTNMSEPLRNEIIAKGINPSLVDNISGYAITFSEANVTQESYKGSTKNITLQVSDTLNAIYEEIIGICKIAGSYYKYESLKKELFTFKKIISNLGSPKKSPVPVPELVQ